MTELLPYLMAMAVHLTGLPVVPMPTVVAVSNEQMIAAVCPADPSNCRQIASVYETETNTILYRDSLDLDDDADNSYVLHELVHALQFGARGEAIYANCEALMDTERQAYAIQNAYLKKRGKLLRVGEVLRWARCPTMAAEQ